MTVHIYGLIQRANKILTVRVIDHEFSGKYSDMTHLPGGRRNEGEDNETALKREILEETGYQIQLVQPEPCVDQVIGFEISNIGWWFTKPRLLVVKRRYAQVRLVKFNGWMPISIWRT